jgi:hypothetical protein
MTSSLPLHVIADDIAQYLSERRSRVYTLEQVHEMTGFALTSLEADCRDGKVKHTRRGRTIGMTLRQIDMLVEAYEVGETPQPGFATHSEVEESLRGSAARIRPPRARRVAA